MSTEEAKVETPAAEAPAVVEAAAEAPAAAAATPAVAPENAAVIVEQVEFYFGDSNLTKPDKFLIQKIKDSEEGYVELSILGSFKRMKELVPSQDVQIIAAALRTSKDDLLDVHEDGTKVRRSATRPLPKESMYNKTALYTKGWALDGTTTIDTVKAYFVEKGFKVLSVRLRYAFQTKEFKGSVFVEMADVDSAIKATKEEFKVGDNTLVCEMKEVYHQRKKSERNDKKAEKKAEGGGGGAAAKEEEKEEPIIEGCVLGFKGVPDDTSREDFKEAFGKYADVSWVDFQRGDTSGEVRFAGPDATKVMEGCKKDEIKINGVVPELSVLTGEAEAEFWKKVAASRKESKNRGRKSKFGGRGRGGGGRGRGGKKYGGKRSRDDGDDSGAKRAKTEE